MDLSIIERFSRSPTPSMNISEKGTQKTKTLPYVLHTGKELPRSTMLIMGSTRIVLSDEDNLVHWFDY